MEPHLTECCGQHYCKTCIERWLSTSLSKTCPQCRFTPVTHILDKSLERRIQELDVSCGNTSHGCKWIDSLCNLEHHLKSCPYALVKCSNGCGAIVARREIDAHEKEQCGLRPVSCQFCTGTYSISSDHSCPEQPVSCEKCSKKISRAQIQSHLEKDCTNETSQEDIAEEVRGLACEMADLKHEITVLHQEREELKTELKSAAHRIADTEDAVSSLKAESKTLRSTLLQELDFLHSSPQPHEELVLECIKTQLKHGHRVICLKITEQPATFRLFPYSQYKLGKTWYSSPFCLSNKYQFCIAVHLYGLGAGQSTHVSLCLHQMRGKYDQHLKWPFLLQADLEVRLLRQVPGVDSPRSNPKKQLSSLGLVSTDTRPKLKKANTHPAGSPTQSDLEHTQVYAKEILRVSKILSQVTNSKIGPAVSSLELFRLQSSVESLVYRNSLVLQVHLNSLI